MKRAQHEQRRAGIYCRLSEDRSGEGLNVETQERDCRKLVAARGWSVVEPVYVDNDISAYDKRKRRPEFDRLIEDVKAGLVEVIVCLRADRLYRRPAELESIIDVLDAADVPVEQVRGGPIDLSSANGRAHARVFGAMASWESEVKAERVGDKHRQEADAGRHHGPRPYGYRKGPDGTLVVDRAEAKIVREIATRIVEGESLRRIMADLNERGVPSPKGSRWQATTTRAVVRRATVVGSRELKGVEIGRGLWKPILDRGLWERVRSVLGDPARQRHVAPGRRYVMAGLVFTAEGVRMKSQSAGDKLKVYAGPGVAISVARLEDEVLRQMWRRLDDVDSLPVDTSDRAAVDHAEAIAAIEAELADLVRQRLAGELELVEFDLYRADARARLEAARRAAPPARLSARTVAALRDPAALRRRYDDGDLAAKRQIVKAVIARVTVDPSRQGGGRVFDPSRIHVEFRI